MVPVCLAPERGHDCVFSASVAEAAREQKETVASTRRGVVFWDCRSRPLGKRVLLQGTLVHKRCGALGEHDPEDAEGTGLRHL